MIRTFFKLRLSKPVVNGLLAMMLLIATFATANAQEASNRIMLPLVQSSSAVEQASEFKLDPNAQFTIEGSTAEVSAATSCYGGAKYIPSFSISPNSYSGWSPIFYASNRCQDVNIWLNSTVPLQAQIKFYPTYGQPYVTGWRWTGKHTWRVIASNLIDGTKFQIRLKNHTNQVQNFSGKLAY